MHKTDAARWGWAGVVHDVLPGQGPRGIALVPTSAHTPASEFQIQGSAEKKPKDGVIPRVP